MIFTAKSSYCHDEIRHWFTDTEAASQGAAVAESGSSSGPTMPSAGSSPGAGKIAYYTCAMHPSVKLQHPGTCPICKMDLIPVTQEKIRSGIIFVDAQRRQLIGVRTTIVGKRDLQKTIRAVGVVTH